jgi:hypothetical protein
MRSVLMVVLLACMLSACSDSSFSGGSAVTKAPTQPSEADATPALPVDEEQGISDLDGDGVPGFPPQAEVDELRATCLNNASKIVSKTQVLNFPERKNCSFDSSPNLSRRDAFNQASETSPGILNLPAGTICDLGIRSPANAQLQYDDFLILTIAGQAVFVSNSGLTEYLVKQQNIYYWDFSKIVGQPIRNFNAPSYCLGAGSNCVLPGHDQRGAVMLNLTSKEIAPIALSIEGKTTAEMNLIATGDNDDEDCFHSALELTVEYKYLPN